MLTKQLVQPCQDRVLVSRIAAVTEIKGIIVPDQNQEKPNEGIIVAIGPCTLTSALEDRRTAEDPILTHGLYPEQTFDLGDHILFGKYAGTEITVDEQVFVLLKPDEVMAKIITVPAGPESGTVPVAGEAVAE